LERVFALIRLFCCITVVTFLRLRLRTYWEKPLIFRRACLQSFTPCSYQPSGALICLWNIGTVLRLNHFVRIGNQMISSAIWKKISTSKFFKDYKKIALALRARAICSLWKIYECLFIPNCMRKIIWLLVNKIQVTISVTLQYFTWQMEGQVTSTLLDENLTCEFKRKNSFNLSKSCMKTEWEVSLLPVKSSIYSHLNSRTWPESRRKRPCG